MRNMVILVVSDHFRYEVTVLGYPSVGTVVRPLDIAETRMTQSLDGLKRMIHFRHIHASVVPVHQSLAGKFM